MSRSWFRRNVSSGTTHILSVNLFCSLFWLLESEACHEEPPVYHYFMNTLNRFSPKSLPLLHIRFQIPVLSRKSIRGAWMVSLSMKETYEAGCERTIACSIRLLCLINKTEVFGKITCNALTEARNNHRRSVFAQFRLRSGRAGVWDCALSTNGRLKTCKYCSSIGEMFQ